MVHLSQMKLHDKIAVTIISPTRINVNNDYRYSVYRNNIEISIYHPSLLSSSYFDEISLAVIVHFVFLLSRSPSEAS